MPDNIFSIPRLAAIYDHFDGDRADLPHYLRIAKELKAQTVLDVGCGTGSFACMLSQHGFQVTGVDPAEASLNIARSKPHANNVRWILGDASSLPAMATDLVIMTGNVAQVFVTDMSWERCLSSARRALDHNGHLVFEVRDPKQRDWENWTKEKTFKRVDVPTIGIVEEWCDILNVSNELVSFRWTYTFDSDGVTLTSDSTLRFRGRDEIERSLEKSGFLISSVRDAPDRPGKEFVFICALR